MPTASLKSSSYYPQSISEFSELKIIDPKNIGEKIAEIKKKDLTIATLNGSFDLLHAGHLYIIYEASKTADILIVALNTDESIKKYKSPKQPIISLPQRVQMMTALSFVDYVTWFDETDPCNILNQIKPNVHVNGVEYGENCIEAATVKSNGGRVHLVERIPGLATSQIVKKIKATCD
jgi:rfaE bifunctional protein nucleotidyltransferase chain/domain